MAALWQQQRPWATSCSAIRYAGPAAAPFPAAAVVAPVPAAPVATTTTTAAAALIPATTVQALERSNEVLSRQRWAAVGLVLLAAVILLVLMLWVWLKDRCTGDGDCASLCPRADVPCASRCNRGRCEQVPVSCTQPGQAWCPSRRACIDTRTEVCAAPGFMPVAPITPPPPPVTPAPVPTPPVIPAPAVQHGLVGQQQQQVPPFPLPASPWDASGGAVVPTAPHGGVAPMPAPPVEPDDFTAVSLVPVMMRCVWEAAYGPQTVVVNGVTYVVDAQGGTVRLIDGDGRPWECGSGGRWWHMGPLDGAGPMMDGTDDNNSGNMNDYYEAAAADTVVCWDQGMDIVWTSDAYGRTWAAPRKGAQGWAPCDPASGASSVAPPPPVTIDAATARHDIARGRASMAAAAAAVTPNATTAM
ncbi:hypothetical protein pmac_cds_241 [Pandoravirus macleodensis]|uniref:Uncharacterized protein n=1 Tax=Pandoravirus macleodensis TaxID=2107707 RepID=A0A2U7UEN4_9VIRU|nr:hypothetical protein pmac_cds_241 [Pandoravirus macleodensis]AVK76929.1 hypothetical protein pmac_cds_241 [Pandoravirus macleodensis]